MTAPQWQENIQALTSVSGASTDASVVDPTAAASAVALLKGLINANTDNVTLFASGVVTTNSNSADTVNYRARGAKVFIATGSFGSGASGIVVTIQGKDPVSGNYYDILASAAVSANGFQPVLTVYPGLAAIANQVVSDVIPKTWRVKYTAANWGTGGSTLGISCAMIV